MTPPTSRLWMPLAAAAALALTGCATPPYQITAVAPATGYQGLPASPLLQGWVVCKLPVTDDGEITYAPTSATNDFLITFFYPDVADGSSSVALQCINIAKPDQHYDSATVKIVDGLIQGQSQDNEYHPFFGLKLGDLQNARLNSAMGQKHPFHTADGRNYWAVAQYIRTDQDTALLPDRVTIDIYPYDPDLSQPPIETKVFATLKGRDWMGPRHTRFTQDESGLTEFRAVMDDAGRTVIGIKVVQEAPPSLDELLQVNDTGAAEARWLNHQLLRFKNEELPGLLKEEKTKQLASRVSAVEGCMLDLNQKIASDKDKAQEIVEKNQGDPALLREAASLLSARIEVLKLILADIKQELDDRKK